MKKRGRQFLALALSCSSFAAMAADQLVWSETFQRFTPTFQTVGSINTATVPGGMSGALVTDP
ncbi:MAG: PEP-CTERM sorting domain-containing protein, partial [Methyloversatilis sp.]|nr:PEP-CTERM sorting domain-containing protein [Methyloversatilis sp.]